MRSISGNERALHEHIAEPVPIHFLAPCEQAAVSPPSSGLLGSDVVNFEKLKAMKTRNQTPTASSTGRSGTADSSRSSRSPAEDAMRMTRGSTMSPLNSLSQLQLDRRQSVSTENADVQALHLDGSDATTSDPADRSGSVETEDDLPDEEDMTDIERDRYGLGAGGDVLASLEMDGVE